MRLILSILVLTLVPITCPAAPASQETSNAPLPHSATMSATQVDGICSRVVDQLWVRSDYYWHTGDYPRVVGVDRIITEDDPHFLEPYSNGGWLLESMGRNADAEAYYRLGVTNNPNEAYLWHQIGFFYYNTLKNYPKAIAAFQGATRQKDVTIISWKMLAHSYEKNKQLPEAIAVWQLLDKRHPNDGVIMHNLQRDQAALAAAQSSSVSRTAPVQ